MYKTIFALSALFAVSSAVVAPLISGVSHVSRVDANLPLVRVSAPVAAAVATTPLLSLPLRQTVVAAPVVHGPVITGVTGLGWGSPAVAVAAPVLASHHGAVLTPVVAAAPNKVIVA